MAKDDDEEFIGTIDFARKTGTFDLGEHKLLDDIYEASQEGAPLHEEIASFRESVPVAETPADLQALFETEPEVFKALLDQALPGRSGTPQIAEIERTRPGEFRVGLMIPGEALAMIIVDGVGRLLRKLA